MSRGIDLNAYSDALVVLGTAGILIPLLRRWRLNPVLGYLGAGAVLGPLGLGSMVHGLPLLYWFTISDADKIAGIAELGIVFLLFLIGLELSLSRLMAMRHLIVGLGSLQVLLTAALISVVVLLAGQRPTTAIILGAGLSLSSTAIVLELLSEQKRMATSVGRASVAILLAQDIAVIPMLIFISIAGASAGGSVLDALGKAFLQAAIALAVIVVLGRLLLRPLFRLVAGTHSREVFIAAVLFVIVGTGVIAHQAGLSMALGAFVAGLLLAETEYRKAVEAIVDPFKGMLLGIFFFTIGMNIDFRELVREPGWLLLCVAGLIAGKSVLLALLGRVFRLSWASAGEVGLLLGAGGEFAFVGIGMAETLQLVDRRVADFSLLATSITMGLTPLLATAGRRLTRGVGKKEEASDPELSLRPTGGRRAAIVIGYGRVGRVVCSLLGQHAIPYVAMDHDPQVVVGGRQAGDEVYYGHVADPDFLRACGLEDAIAVIVTIGVREPIDEIVAHVHAVRPEVPIIARALDADHARHLYMLGATDAVPETVEASLQLSEAALLGVGIGAAAASASVHEKRNELRHELQRAAKENLPDRP